MNVRKILPYAITSVFFVSFMTLGILIHKDFGISWDEPVSRINGFVNIKYISEVFGLKKISYKLSSFPNLYDWKDKDYGVSFELISASFELAIYNRFNSLKDAFEFRHLLTFIFYIFGITGFWAVLIVRYRSSWVALLGVILFISSPRMFGESFYNSKDLVLMACFAISLFTISIFLIKMRMHYAILHGFVTAFTIDIRVVGVSIFLATIAILFCRCVKGDLSFRKFIFLIITFTFTTIIFTYIMFPFLWFSPIENFIVTLKNMAKFRWQGAGVLYFGEIIPASELPWHYLPVWIIITLPALTLISFLIGSGLVVKRLLSANVRLWRNTDEMLDITYFAFFLGPLFAVIVLQSVLYDGWRQMYFIYPALVLLSTRGLVAVRQFTDGRSRFLHVGLFALVAGCLLHTGGVMVQTHPYQSLYFNALAGQNIKARFDFDYWGIVNRDALAWIAKTAPTDAPITVGSISAMNLSTSLKALPPEAKSRFVLLPSQQAKGQAEWLLQNFRLVDPEQMEQTPTGYVNWKEWDVRGETTLRIYRHMPHIQ